MLPVIPPVDATGQWVIYSPGFHAPQKFPQKLGPSNPGSVCLAFPTYGDAPLESLGHVSVNRESCGFPCLLRHALEIPGGMHSEQGNQSKLSQVLRA